MQAFNLIFSFAFSLFPANAFPFPLLYCCSDKIRNLCLVYFENLFWFNWIFFRFPSPVPSVAFFSIFSQIFSKKRRKLIKWERKNNKFSETFSKWIICFANWGFRKLFLTWGRERERKSCSADVVSVLVEKSDEIWINVKSRNHKSFKQNA